jgi:hypothetical protein
MSVIDTIEIKIHGKDWNTVKLSEYKNNRRIEHEYGSVSKDVVMKLLNSRSNPTISDFEGWIKDDDQKQKKSGSEKDFVIEGNAWFC